MAQIPHAEEGKVCPFHKVDVSTVCHKCPLWQMIRGTKGNTGEVVDEWGCAIAWLPTLMVNTAQQVAQAGAATESFRNEVVRMNEEGAAQQLDAVRRLASAGALLIEHRG